MLELNFHCISANIPDFVRFQSPGNWVFILWTGPTTKTYTCIAIQVKYRFAVGKAATILRLLGSETIHFNNRGKNSEPGLRKQLNKDVKSTTKFIFFFKYLYILQI